MKQWYLMMVGLLLIMTIVYLRYQGGVVRRESATFFNEHIVELALQNTFFRKEVCTGNHSQIVLMSVAPGQEVGTEIHQVDQILFFVDGHGVAILNDIESDVSPYHMVFVPSGVQHNVKNTSSRDMKICTIYAPAEHKPGTQEELKQ